MTLGRRTSYLFQGVLCFAALLALTATAKAAAITLDFEGFPDSTILATQYPGLTFTNAIILTAGISLNEFEFPPRSGVNVVSDNGGPMTIDFSTPVTSFGGYFTYLEPLTLDAFNAGNNQVASTKSLFSDNLACLAGPPCSGDSGSSPNEFLQMSDAGGISSVTITGDPAGGSFTLDDATYVTAMKTAVPEPGTVLLLLIGTIGFVSLRRISLITTVLGYVVPLSWLGRANVERGSNLVAFYAPIGLSGSVQRPWPRPGFTRRPERCAPDCQSIRGLHGSKHGHYSIRCNPGCHSHTIERFPLRMRPDR